MTLGVHGRVVRPPSDNVIARVTRDAVSVPERGDHVFVCEAPPDDVGGYAAVLCDGIIETPLIGLPVIDSVRTEHLRDGDVVGIDRRGYVRTLYRRASLHNSIFATDHCNSLCLMCSQPPRDVDETGIVQRHLRLIRLIDPATKELGISGGEPTLLGDGLLEIVRECRDRLPNTALHILSNGRLFANGPFAERLASIRHPDLMIGIPLYSDIDSEHDYVVQARGAFGETMQGIHNLGRYGAPVEIRVVLHKQTYERLPQLAEFLYRNVTFASQVVLMGLEITGFTIPNLESLWIDPCDYQPQLLEATLFLAGRGIVVWIYNHQLCTLPRDLWPFSRRSISDWKNEYVSQCSICEVQQECGGFFSSAVERHRTSRGIAAVCVDSSASKSEGRLARVHPYMRY